MFRFFAHTIRSSVFLQNSIVLFAGTMVANVLNYVFHFVIGRMVEPAVYGEVESIVSLLVIVSVPGTAIAIIATRYAASAKASGDRDMSRKIFRYINTKMLFFGGGLFVGAIVLTPWVMEFLKIDRFVAMAMLWGMMLLSFFSASATGMLSGWQKFGWVSIGNVASAAAKLFFSVLFVMLGFSVSGVVGAFFLASVAGYAIFTLFLRRLHRQAADDASSEMRDESPRGETLPSMRSYAFPVLWTSLAVAILGNVDMVLAKYHLDPDTAGVYGALFIVSKTIYFVGGILVSVMFAMASEEHDRVLSGVGSNSKLFRNAFALTALFSIGAVAFFALFPTFVLQVFFGATYVGAAEYLGWFALANAFLVLAHFLSQHLLAIRRTGIAYALLAVAIAEIPMVFLLGGSIESVIMITVVFQAAAFAVAAAALWHSHKKHATLSV